MHASVISYNLHGTFKTLPYVVALKVKRLQHMILHFLHFPVSVQILRLEQLRRPDFLPAVEDQVQAFPPVIWNW